MEPTFQEKVVSLPIEQVRTKPTQVREEFPKEQLEELAESIKSSGQLVPIIVHPTEDGAYEVVAGERRHRATRMAGKKHITCIVVEEMEPRYILLYSAIENLQRENLKDREVERTMYDLYAEGKNGWSCAVIGKMVGKSSAWVEAQIQNYNDRANLSSSTKDVFVDKDKISGTFLRETRPVKDEEIRAKILSKPDLSPAIREKVKKVKRIDEVREVDSKAADDLKERYLKDEIDEDDIETVAETVKTAKEFRPAEVKMVAKESVKYVAREKAEEKATERVLERARDKVKTVLAKEAKGEKVEPDEVETIKPAYEKAINRAMEAKRILFWELDVSVISAMPAEPQKRLHSILDDIFRMMHERMEKIDWK